VSRPPVWAPWRIDHILDPDKHTGGCVLCELALAPPDEERLVLHRGTTAYVVMNRYPYTSGHAMVAPLAHTADLALLDGGTLNEMMALVQRVMGAIQAVYAPHGFNVGMNLGEAAGAGVVDHLHLHVVPRWRGDSNFMSVSGGVRVLPEDLATTLGRLRAALEGDHG